MDHAGAGVRVAVAILPCLVLAGACSNPSAPPIEPPLRRTASVVVIDSLGSPAANVRVRLVSDGDSAGFARVFEADSDAQGSVVAVLIEGGWGVHALRDGGSPTVAGTTFTVAGRARPATDTVVVRIELHTPSVARGRVRLGGRTNHAGTVVDCPPVPTALVTDSTGTYQVGLLPPGHWTITMFHTGFRLGVASIQVAQPGQTLDVPDVLLISDPILNAPQ